MNRAALAAFAILCSAGPALAWSARALLDAALLFGVTSNDPSVGVAAGFTYVFNAFQVP